MGTLDRYYKVLGIEPGATLQEINQAYAVLLNRLHPSRSSDDPRQRSKAQAQAKEINEAYGVIRKGVPPSGESPPSREVNAAPEPPSRPLRNNAPADHYAASPLKSVRRTGNLVPVALSAAAVIISLRFLLPSLTARRDAPHPLPARLPIVRPDAAPKLPALPAPPPRSAGHGHASPAARREAPPPLPAKHFPPQPSPDRYAEDAASRAAAVRESAEGGDRLAQGWLAYLYATGQGVPRNYGEAAAWYRRAADQGNAEAQDWLGYLYETGRGVPQDYSQSALWYRRAAEQGDAEAQKNLALLYANGRGVDRNLREAIKWYSRAAAQGNAEAQRALEIWREP